MESLVDYVLERGNVDYGEFAPKREADQNSMMYNHRKLLTFLFEDPENIQYNILKRREHDSTNQKRISDMKIEEISGQLNYFSEKVHA